MSYPLVDVDANLRTTAPPPETIFARKTLSTVRIKDSIRSTSFAASDSRSHTPEAAVVTVALSVCCLYADCVPAALLGRVKGRVIVIRLGQRNTLGPTGKATAGTKLLAKDSATSPWRLDVIILLPFALQNIIGQPFSLKTVGAHSSPLDLLRGVFEIIIRERCLCTKLGRHPLLFL